MEEELEKETNRYPEYAELGKNSKGYSWKIRIFLKEEDRDKDILKRIEKMDSEFREYKE